jgi:hypothetical protein
MKRYTIFSRSFAEEKQPDVKVRAQSSGYSFHVSLVSQVPNGISGSIPVLDAALLNKFSTLS